MPRKTPPKSRNTTYSPRVARRVTPERFVEVWSASPTCADAARELSLSPKAASARAALYRQRGVKLKAMPTGRPPMDIASLNKLVAKPLGKPLL